VDEEELIFFVAGVLALSDININLQRFGLVAAKQDLKKLKRQNKEVKNAENRCGKEPGSHVEN
jgi:hypothetical protein